MILAGDKVMASEVGQFDFDMWADLAKKDPAAFEAKRREEIQKVMSLAKGRNQKRLEGLQWRIDMGRRLNPHPLASCAKIFNMMWDSMYGERGLLDAINMLNHDADQALLAKTRHPKSGDVLNFKSLP